MDARNPPPDFDPDVEKESLAGEAKVNRR